MKAYIIRWSEGGPTCVLARSFHEAIDVFVKNLASDGSAETAEQATDWIEGVDLWADEVLVAGRILHGTETIEVRP